MISDKFIKDRDEDFSPYEEIKITENDVLYIKKVPSDIFEKLHLISEYRLAIELSKWKITKEEFDWAMKYWKFLISYFKN